MPKDAAAQLLTAYPVLHHALLQREVRGGPGGTTTVTAHQVTLLAQLDQAVGRTLTDLAVAMGVALPTMSLSVDRMEGLGLVKRERDPVDGRRVALRLTEAGGRLARSRSLLDPVRVRALLASLTAAERTAGVEAVVALARAAQRLGSSSPPSRSDRHSRGRP